MTPTEIETKIKNLLGKFNNLYLANGSNDIDVSLSDYVLIPTKRSILIRGRGKSRRLVDTEFKGAGRVEASLGYLSGVARMQSLENDSTMKMFYVRKD